MYDLVRALECNVKASQVGGPYIIYHNPMATSARYSFGVATGGLNAKQKERLLLEWFTRRCDDDCSIEAFCAGLDSTERQSIGFSDLSYLKNAVNDLELIALRRLRTSTGNFDGASEVDEVVKSKVKDYVSMYPTLLDSALHHVPLAATSKDKFDDKGRVRSLVMDWFVARDHPSIRNYLRMRNESSLAPRVNHLVQKANLHRLRKTSQSNKSRVVAAQRIDSVLCSRPNRKVVAPRKKHNRRRRANKKKRARNPISSNETFSTTSKRNAEDDDWMDISICSGEDL